MKLGDRQGVVIFFCVAVAVEFIYQSAAENLIRIRHVLESSRKFWTQDMFVYFSRIILHDEAKTEAYGIWMARLSTKRPSRPCCTRGEQRRA